MQMSIFQAAGLRSSILRAYAAFAVQLAYNEGRGFPALATGHEISAFEAVNVTSVPGSRDAPCYKTKATYDTGELNLPLSSREERRT
jgi:hypothetical protein